MPAPVAVVDQVVEVAASPNRHLERIERKIGTERPRGLPAHDEPGEGIDDEGHVDEHAERLIGGLRREVLDHVLILGRRHLSDVLREYAGHHNSHRPHRGLGLRPPRDVGRSIPTPGPPRPKATERREILGGLIHEYHARAA